VDADIINVQGMPNKQNFSFGIFAILARFSLFFFIALHFVHRNIHKVGNWSGSGRLEKSKIDSTLAGKSVIKILSL